MKLLAVTSNSVYLIEAEWRINTSENKTITGSDNGLSPVFGAKALSEPMIALC